MKKHGLEQQAKRNFITNFKAQIGCKDCGESAYFILCFHHEDRKDKNFQFFDIMNNEMEWEEIFNEIKKCDVMCLNCHRRWHYYNDPPAKKIKKGGKRKKKNYAKGAGKIILLDPPIFFLKGEG